MASESKIAKNNLYHADLKLLEQIGTDYSFRRKIVWFNALGFFALHLAALYGIYLGFYAKTSTNLWAFFVLCISSYGVTIGAHRLYTHRAFKARFGVRLALIILHTVAGQNCLYIWARDHRQHHKFSDTDADPHNANRGFFFSHIGWLMSRKHPLVISKGKTVDLSDLEADQLVMFQKRFYKTLYTIFSMAIPIGIPIYCWNESPMNSLFISYFARSIIMLNGTWCINSVSHIYGTKPYDSRLRAVENNFVGYMTFGEGWHNYHHSYPWDYRASELGAGFNSSTAIINILHRLGMVYDLKTTPYSMVRGRAVKYGDGTHKPLHDKMVRVPD